MPNYEYRCADCKKTFSTTMSFREYDRRGVKCPHCESGNVKQQVVSVGVKTSSKS